jgi:hypothetical protein
MNFIVRILASKQLLCKAGDLLATKALCDNACMEPCRSARRFAHPLLRISVITGALAALALLAHAPAQAIAHTDFSVTIGPAVLCRDKLEMKFYYDYLKGSFGQPYKHEQGAYWFRTKAQLFGKDLNEVFVSDQSTDWEFVGAVFKVKPDELAKTLQSDVGPIYIKTAAGYQYSPYATQSLSEIMWQGNNAKLLCRHHVAPLH